jgi:hypothetical protein
MPDELLPIPVYDLVPAYLRGTSRYKEIVVFIYDESASVTTPSNTAPRPTARS